MKFGKELTSQMVQEWQDAYTDYNGLKKLLKDILHFRPQNGPPSMAIVSPKDGLKRRVSLYRAFSGLTSRYIGPPLKNEEEVILVHDIQEEDGLSPGHYQTFFLRSSDEGAEYELLFFEKLDTEFNKVLEFYKNKVEEVIVEADELSKQMNALIALRIKIHNPIIGGDALIDLAAYNGVSEPSPSTLGTNNAGKPRPVMDAIREVDRSCEMNLESDDDKEEDDEENSYYQKDISEFRPPPLQVLDRVQIKIEPETPILTLQTLLLGLKSKKSFSKKELKKAEELMSQAMVEFYQKLRLLKSYCFLNQLAFSKILKKYDKITLWNASKAYMRTVDNSYLGRSDEVAKLMVRVEATYIKHFVNGNHRKGMKTLRPKPKREKHRITYLLGLFTGCTIALIVAILLLIHARNILNHEGRDKYMENIFPLYSLFGFIALHLMMYAGNIFYWKRYHVNYTFIFGFKQGDELGYREVLLLSSGLAAITLACVISNLDMEMDERTQSFKAVTELVPLALLIVTLLIFFCPFNIINRSNRFILLQCIFHCICAPLYKVTLPDFFLGDQLTSQVQAFRSVIFYVCYYGWGDFTTRTNNCVGSQVYRKVFLVIGLIPYWFRFAQCIRRLLEEKDPMHSLNGLKYLSTIIALAMRTTFQFKGKHWLIMASTTSAIATVFNTYWDLVVDWGLLRRNSKNPWLRDKLIIPNRSVYFIAMVVNVVLRLAWMQTVLGIREAPFLHRTALTALVASLEIVRRGIWNFFRLENEHLNNVGKYRAFKSVPLPFHYD